MSPPYRKILSLSIVLDTGPANPISKGNLKPREALKLTVCNSWFTTILFKVLPEKRSKHLSFVLILVFLEIVALSFLLFLDLFQFQLLFILLSRLKIIIPSFFCFFSCLLTVIWLHILKKSGFTACFFLWVLSTFFYLWN